ncbi:unnamed protein product [Mytilus coruscus]|uniref:B box-type domain-containing protein n=1 Tax=Mytilus coruscus TaxID=42192 RepID=A0A6J7ZYU2_MYTCO|nr:unnamed protein product [Mytilus coruscus]
MAQAASKTCEICVSSPGYNYCEQCDQLFCNGCKISHLRTKISKNHTFLSGLNINPDIRQFCKEHDENFIYYCMECDTLICKICVIKKHKAHDFVEIKESTEGIKAESNIAEVDQGSHTYQADVKEVIQAIKEEGRKLKEMIDKKVEALINTVRQKDAKNVKNLQSVGNELKTALDKAKEQQKFYQDTQKIKDTTKLLQKLIQIKSQIEQKEEIQIPVMPSVKYAQQKATESEAEKLFGELTFEESVRRKENPKPQKNVRVQQHINNTDTDATDADESGFPQDPKSGKILAAKGSKIVYSTCSADKSQITVLACMSATAHYLPPMLVFPGERFRHNPLEGFTEAVLGRTKTGWLNHHTKTNKHSRKKAPSSSFELLLVTPNEQKTLKKRKTRTVLPKAVSGSEIIKILENRKQQKEDEQEMKEKRKIDRELKRKLKEEENAKKEEKKNEKKKRTEENKKRKLSKNQKKSEKSTTSRLCSKCLLETDDVYICCEICISFYHAKCSDVDFSCVHIDDIVSFPYECDDCL